MKIYNNTIITFVVLVLSTALISCGAKPKNIDPPRDSDLQRYPRTYPDIHTDPVVHPPLP